jgi:flagellar operon protein
VALNGISGIGAGQFAPPTTAAPVRSGSSFTDALAQAGNDLRLSRHAQKRVDARDLNLDQGRMDRLNSAVTQAAAKGSRTSVVMLDNLAVVVDVRQRTVVTAMQQQGGSQRVFTNIDSVVIA